MARKESSKKWIIRYTDPKGVDNSYKFLGTYSEMLEEIHKYAAYGAYANIESNADK